MLKTALALRHVHFEDLGVFAPVLVEHGYRIDIVDAPYADLSRLASPDLLVVLGGPVGVSDIEAYPFLAGELDILRERLAAGRPTLGVCLGAQLMAAALGAQVGSNGGKEIGFAPLTLTPAGASGPLGRLDGVPVLHWHGDRFEIPPGAERLASTTACANQAFSLGAYALGLQFHPEVDSQAIESWLVGHAAELAGAGIDPAAVRADARRYGVALKAAGQAMLADWLDQLAS